MQRYEAKTLTKQEHTDSPEVCVCLFVYQETASGAKQDIRKQKRCFESIVS